MSHFTVLVAGNDVEALLAPFDEDLEVPRYLSETREQLIEGQRSHYARMRDTWYAEYLADPAGYLARCSNPAHARYVTSGEFAEKLTWTDEQLWADATRWDKPGELDEDGARWSTSNPRSKWDWWVVGGRWAGGLSLQDGRPADSCRRDELSVEDTAPTFAVVIGQDWHERGSMGWWGVVSDEQDDRQWHPQWLKLVAALPGDTTLTLVDAHI